MHEDFSLRSRSPSPRSGVSTRAVLGTSLLAFLGGALMIGWLVWDGQIAIAPEEIRPQSIAALPLPSPSATASLAAQAQAQATTFEGRMAALEQRLARIDLQAAASEGNTSRTEALLIVLAARRAVERGVALGYLEEQLRLRFADAQPKAVQAVIEAGAKPISLEQLSADLDRLAPQLIDRPANEGGWDRLTRELSDLFVIRRNSAPSGKPQDRLERARLLLRSGHYGHAAEEVAKLPGAAAAKDWIATANRHEAACRALDLIETTALLDPDRLKSGDGRKVVQPSPVVAPTSGEAPTAS